MKPPVLGPLTSVICSLLSLLCLLLTACGKRETFVAAGIRTQTLHINNGAAVRDLDPHTLSVQPEINVAHALFEGLTEAGPTDSQPIPGVAERWECSPDGLTWTFHLRANARWSNGDPVTAGDFLFAYERILSPALAAAYREQFFCLRNARDFSTGKNKAFSSVGVHAPDEHTLVLTLEHAVPHLPALTTQPWWGPLHRKTIEKFGRIDQRATAWTRPGNLVGNGAFVLKELSPGIAVRVVKSPAYWDRDRVRLAEAVFHAMPDYAVAEVAFRAGQLHLTPLHIEKAAAYKGRAQNAKLLHEATGATVAFYRLNCARPPLNDVRVRRALSLAVDREQLARRVLHSDEAAAVSLTPPNCGGYTADRTVTMNVAEARRLLAEAGFASGKGMRRLELLWFEGLPGERPLAEAIQEMWRTHLGIQVELVLQEIKVAIAARRTGTYDIAAGGWFPDYVDPTTFLDLLRSTDGNNVMGWASSEYDALLQQAMRTLDPAKRFETLRRAETLMLGEAPIIPIYYLPNRELRHPAVKGWEHNPLDLHPLKFVYLEN